MPNSRRTAHSGFGNTLRLLSIAPFVRMICSILHNVLEILQAPFVRQRSLSEEQRPAPAGSALPANRASC